MARPVTISVSGPGRAWQRLRQMYVDLRQKNDDVYSRSSLLGLATIHQVAISRRTMHRPGTCSEDHDATCSKGDACAKTFFQRSCYPDNLA